METRLLLFLCYFICGNGQDLIPQNVVAVVINSTSILVYWRAPTEAVYIYRATMQLVNGGDEILGTDNTRELQFTFSALKPFNTYEAQVACKTESGEFGQNVTAARQTTWPAAPGKPKDLKVEEISISSIFVSWLSPDNENGNIANYTVTLRVKDTNTIKDKKVQSELQHTFEGLDEGIGYSISVFATTLDDGNGNGGGSGDSATVDYTITGLIKPTAVTAKATSPTNIMATWTMPEGTTASYIVHCKHAMSEDETEYQCPNSENLECDISSLKPYVQYSVKVTAINGAGLSGEPTESDIIRTWPTKPTVPLDVTVEVQPPSGIRVSWIEPQYLNGLLLGYNVTLTQTDAQEPLITEITNDTFQTFDSVKMWTTYTVSVFATVGADNDGNGGGSSDVAAAEYSLLGVPTNVEVTDITTDQLRASWTKPPGDDIIYSVSIILHEGNVVTPTTCTNANAVECTISDLQPNTEYRIKVWAQQGENGDKGDPAESKVVRTLEKTTTTATTSTTSGTEAVVMPTGGILCCIIYVMRLIF